MKTAVILLLSLFIFIVSNTINTAQHVSKTEIMELQLACQQQKNKRLCDAITNHNIHACRAAINAEADVNTPYDEYGFFNEADFHLPLNRIEMNEANGMIIRLLQDYGAESSCEAAKIKSKTVQLKMNLDRQLEFNKVIVHALNAAESSEVIKQRIGIALLQGADIDCVYMCEAAHSLQVDSISEYSTKPERKTPLLIGINHCKSELVQFLLEQGADPNKTVDSEIIDCPLFAAVNQEGPLAELLLYYGADVYWKNRFGQSIFHIFAKDYPNTEKFNYIVEHINRASTTKLFQLINEKDFFDQTPLMYASNLSSSSQKLKKRLPFLYRLLSVDDVLVDVQMNNGKTALMIAAEDARNIHFLKLLVGSGRCDYCITCYNGKTAVDYAQEVNNKKAIELLQDPQKFIEQISTDKHLKDFDWSFFKQYYAL